MNDEFFNNQVEELAAPIRAVLKDKSPDFRLAVLSAIAAGLCRECGYETDGDMCYCTRDD